MPNTIVLTVEVPKLGESEQRLKVRIRNNAEAEGFALLRPTHPAVNQLVVLLDSLFVDLEQGP
jgi:hypothetical protein